MKSRKNKKTNYKKKITKNSKKNINSRIKKAGAQNNFYNINQGLYNKFEFENNNLASTNAEAENKFYNAKTKPNPEFINHRNQPATAENNNNHSGKYNFNELDRNNLYKKNISLNLNKYIYTFKNLHHLFDNIVGQNRLLLFKDLHGNLEHIYYLLTNLEHLMINHNFNVLFIEMLPNDFETSEKLNDKNEPIQNKINSVTNFFKDHWRDKSKFKNLPSNIMYQCIIISAMHFGYKIYGCDDMSTYEHNTNTFNRYSMNRDISKKITSVLLDKNNKGIGIFGEEHLNMRNPSMGSMGIPYYLSRNETAQFLVIDIINKKNKYYGIKKKFENININEENFVLIKTTPKVDFPHYFIIINIPLDILRTKIQEVCIGINNTIIGI